jgi:hypothetical protein
VASAGKTQPAQTSTTHFAIEFDNNQIFSKKNTGNHKIMKFLKIPGELPMLFFLAIQ